MSQTLNQNQNPILNAPPGMQNLFQPGLTSKNPNSECTLYVGNLNPDLNDTRLFEFFRPFGEVVTCRIMRDIYSGESRRFAFVSFSSKEDAQKALTGLNYTKLDDWEMRICFKRSPSDFKPEGNIFVKNLKDTVMAKDLNDKFAEFGNILSLTVRSDENGKSLGYGYIQYDSEEAANKAIEALNGKELWGQVAEVNKFVASKNRNTEQKNLYIKNFPETMDKASIEEFINTEFKALGTVTSQGVYEKVINENKKHFAFVAFEEQEVAKAVIDKFNNHKFTPEQTLPLYVGVAQNKRQRKQELRKTLQQVSNQTNLYIRSLKPDTEETGLRQVFEKFGPITSICVKTNQKKIPQNDI